MKQRNIKHEKRLKKLILTCLLLAVVLTVGTYAWFIGMQTVSVEAFEVEIAAVEDLALSLDGGTDQSKWGSAITINPTTLNGTGEGKNDYFKQTASWTSLKPVSSVGVIDNSTNKLIMYDKGSLTATDGGYRLMAARVNNLAATGTLGGSGQTEYKVNEEDGYVAFDLFIKNMSGDEYYSELKEGIEGNEEAIYLLEESSALGIDAGSTASGIENSVRVAFAQIGRVKSDAASSVSQNIQCGDTYVEDENGDYVYDSATSTYKKAASGETGTHKRVVTKICNQRTAAIWEPNDTKHNANAIKWYDLTCKQRSADGKFATEAIGCKEIDVNGEKPYALTDEKFVQTYAVSGVISESDNVDVYDGLNGYSSSIATTPTAGKLLAFDTFTDTDKMAEDRSERVPIFYLAPNSVTKIRVYIYLEGQDVDNYDFASLGNKIKINFGFTKEKFKTEDIDENITKPEGAEGYQAPSGS